ncbi:hypothetical protein HDV00_006539 [Rhizophlyctis rosea]|nr:hypothetical protein HDV00_006539 [Rhizophlyctis rosea]
MTVRGSSTQTIKNRYKSNGGVPASYLSEIVLNAVGFQSVEVTGNDVKTWQYDGERITIVWEKTFGPEEERKVTVNWVLVKPIAGMYFDVPDKYYPDRVLHSITDNEPELCRYWLPCVDFPTIRTTIEFTITAPSSMTALANGKPVSETENSDGTKITKWKLDQLCPSYLICVCVGEFISVDDGEVNGLQIKYFAPKNIEPAHLKRAFGRTPDMLKWLPEKVGVPFPYPKYYQLSSKLMSGAMENISLVTWGEQYLMDETFGAERGLYTEMTNIHEMAHSYFGDLLVIRHFEHVWLKESWASYTEALWLEAQHPLEEFEFEMLLNADNYMSECGRYMRPMVTRKFDTSWSMFDQHTYPGGAYRIHMLRRLLGDEAFWTGVRNYVQTYQYQVVETDLFRRCLESASGLNLVRFFDQWFYSKGYPKLKAQYTHNPHTRTIQITLEQTQLTSSDSPIPVFSFSLDFSVIDADGKVYTGEAVFDHHTKTSVVIPVGEKKITAIRVDPGMKVLFSMEMSGVGEDILVGTASGGGGAGVEERVWAYRELVRNGSWSALQKIKESILKEPFHGVRSKVAAALGRSKTPGTIEVLLAMVRTEKDPRALAACVEALNVRDEEVRKCLLEVLEREGTLPYRAHAAALENLGLQRNPNDVSYLLAAAKDSTRIGLHAIVRSGALRALGRTRSNEAFHYLLRAVEPGHEPERGRPAAVAALALCAAWQSPQDTKQSIEVLVEMVRREEDLGLKAACVAALVELEAKSAVSAVLATRPYWDERRWSRVEKLVRRLREGGGSGVGWGADKVKEVWRLVEELEGKVRKLEEKDREREGREKAGFGKEKEGVKEGGGRESAEAGGEGAKKAEGGGAEGEGVKEGLTLVKQESKKDV